MGNDIVIILKSAFDQLVVSLNSRDLRCRNSKVILSRIFNFAVGCQPT